MIHRDWKIKDGFYWSPGKADLKSVPSPLSPIKAADGMVIEDQCGDRGDGNWQNFAVAFSYKGGDEVYAAAAGVGEISSGDSFS